MDNNNGFMWQRCEGYATLLEREVGAGAGLVMGIIGIVVVPVPSLEPGWPVTGS